MDIIKEAFEAMGYPYVERSQISMLKVKLVADTAGESNVVVIKKEGAASDS